MQKKILLGICGIGNGHVSRQRLIIERLLEYDVYLILAVPENTVSEIRRMFPQLKVLPISVPWIYCNNMGIDFKSTKKRYEETGIDQFDSFLEFSIAVQEALGGENPDLVMTDYEPNVAQFAYATNRTLICLDQHSKFLILPNQIINNHAINIEISRLLYFFPKADKRYVSSFFEIEENKEYNVEMLPPIVKKIQRTTSFDLRKVVVYFSTYTSNPTDYLKVLELIKEFGDYDFYIYTEIDFPDYNECCNLFFEKISDKFNDDLYDCNFIISSAGHQLISEAINLEIPLFIFPLETYDQNYCSYIVEKNRIGKVIKDFNKEEFLEYLERVEFYRKNIKHYKEKFWKENWDTVLFRKLEHDFEITKKVQSCIKEGIKNG